MHCLLSNKVCHILYYEYHVLIVGDCYYFHIWLCMSTSFGLGNRLRLL
jgi:hypothetical protein